MKVTARLANRGAVIAFGNSGGGGVPVVLTHGAGVDHSIFEFQTATLVQRGFRVIVWDLRGHGSSTLHDSMPFTGSDALADLEALLDECNVSRAVLVGHSLGGNLTQAFARNHPERVSAAIIIDSTWNTGALTQFERFMLRLAAPSLSLIPARRLPGVLARASAVTPAAVARAERVFARMPKRRFIEVWRATTAFIDPDPQRRFPLPLALIRGAEDRTGNIRDAMSRWAAADGAADYVIPHAGHLVTWDAPEESSRVLIRILEDWCSNNLPRSGRPS